MKWVVLIVRILVGLPFVGGAVPYFLKYTPDMPPLPEHAQSFGGALAANVDLFFAQHRKSRGA